MLTVNFIGFRKTFAVCIRRAVIDNRNRKPRKRSAPRGYLPHMPSAENNHPHSWLDIFKGELLRHVRTLPPLSRSQLCYLFHFSFGNRRTAEKSSMLIEKRFALRSRKLRHQI